MNLSLRIMVTMLSFLLVGCSNDGITPRSLPEDKSDPPGEKSFHILTDRPLEKMQIFADAFTEQTGVKPLITRLSYEELVAQLKTREGDKSADVIVMKDLVYMNDLSEQGFLKDFNSDYVNENVVKSMRTKNWTAITYRARTLIYRKGFDVSAIQSFSDLGDPKYKGLLCLSGSGSTYNRAMVAQFIEAFGRLKTFNMLKAWLANVDPDKGFFKSDFHAVKDLGSESTDCAMTVANSYYLGFQKMRNPDFKADIQFLEMGNHGVLTNGIVAGVGEKSDQTELAVQFIELMLQPEQQRWFSQSNQDFPANNSVEFHDNVSAWAGFLPTDLNWEIYQNRADEVSDLLLELGYR